MGFELFDIASMAAVSRIDVERLLTQTELPKPANVSARLVRIAGALVRDYGGSIQQLVSQSEELEELAYRLSKLASGFGRAAVVRYLTPIRSLWPVAGDLPATPAVCAAAADLGLAAPHQEAASLPATLARVLESSSGHVSKSTPQSNSTPRPSLIDFEAALDKLGRESCLRGRAQRCPLADACPRRREEESS